MRGGRVREVVIFFKFHDNRSRGLGTVGVENRPLPLTRPMAYTTACTTVQTVMPSYTHGSLVLVHAVIMHEYHARYLAHAYTPIHVQQ